MLVNTVAVKGWAHQMSQGLVVADNLKAHQTIL